jgi:methylisocitrate lyase
MGKARNMNGRGVAKTTRLRRLLRGDGCTAMPGAYNALTARQAARAGFAAVYASGAGLANATAGVPDIGLLTADEVARLAGYIARAVDVPVLADADTGFGGPAKVARTVRLFERAGLAGLHLEDQVFPKRCGHVAGKEVVPTGEMVRKIEAAAAAREDRDFVIVARTDARGVEGFDAAVERARRYVEAGADAIFPEALRTAAEFRAFAKQVDAPLVANMTEFGQGPLLSVRQLGAMGYRLALFPQTALRVAMAAQARCLRDLWRSGSQRTWIDRMQTRQELYELLDYDPEKEWVG